MKVDIDLFLFEPFEPLDNQGPFDFDPHVFRVNANYLDLTILIQVETVGHDLVYNFNDDPR